MKRRGGLFAGLLAAAAAGVAIYMWQSGRQKVVVTGIKQLTDGALPDWLGDLIVFDRRTDGLFEIYTIKPDGTNLQSLTVGKAGAPTGHKGFPAFSPDGQWIAFAAENEYGDHSFATEPGKGHNNDLWVMSADGNSYYHLTHVPQDDGGTLYPLFSRDGSKLTWTEMYARPQTGEGRGFGSWKLMMADFAVVGGVPTISNVQELIPGDNVFYENHGLLPDGSGWMFTSNLYSTVAINKMQIYTYAFSTQTVTALTSVDYNEHAHYSPNGKKITWMRGPETGYETDLWLMNADGSGKKRLTYFNEEGHPEYAGEEILIGDNAWNGLGDQVVFDVIAGTREALAGTGTQRHNLHILRFNRAP